MEDIMIAHVKIFDGSIRVKRLQSLELIFENRDFY
jgi:hypothetical protein